MNLPSEEFLVHRISDEVASLIKSYKTETMIFFLGEENKCLLGSQHMPYPYLFVPCLLNTTVGFPGLEDLRVLICMFFTS